jgi:hypothetical protein
MPRVLTLLAAVGGLGAACFAVLVAGAVDWLACESEGTPACSRQELASTQLTVALVGLVPGVLLVAAVGLRRRRAARLALAVGAAVYLTWAVLVDAAVHGWDDLVLLP